MFILLLYTQIFHNCHMFYEIRVFYGSEYDNYDHVYLVQDKYYDKQYRKKDAYYLH